MSRKSDKTQQPNATNAPSAPEDFYQSGPPPPSYDESIKMSRSTHQYTYTNPTPYQQQQAFLPPNPYATQAPSLVSYGYANPYQVHIQQQESFYNAPSSTLSQMGNGNPAENVLYLAKGAKIRTTASGAISIPPPPPGCAPTPGQVAAMSGQSVVIKKQKKSFF